MSSRGEVLPLVVGVVKGWCMWWEITLGVVLAVVVYQVIRRVWWERKKKIQLSGRTDFARLQEKQRKIEEARSAYAKSKKSKE